MNDESRIHGFNRRRFLQGTAMMGLLAGFESLTPAFAWDKSGNLSAAKTAQGDTDIFNLSIKRKPLQIGSRMGNPITLNGSIPGPLIRLREGRDVILNVTNHLDEDTSIHWHGVLLPNGMDGVPLVTFPGIKPGETFTYRYPVRQHGTYWYHSHSGLQEQLGHYGPLVIDPAEPEPFHFDRDYVVMLSDWTFHDPHTVYAKLKKAEGYYNYQKRTVADFFDDVQKKGWRNAWAERGMWGRMRMSSRDILDVTGAEYTYLINGLPAESNWTGLFKPGEKVRLRFINGSAMTFFDVRIPGLKMTVVAADGQYVEPVPVDEFRIGVAETYDVIVEPSEDRAYTVYAESMDRSGFVRGTLATRDGMSGPIPEMRKQVVERGMDSMGMDMHDMPGMDGMKGMHGMSQNGSGMDMSNSNSNSIDTNMQSGGAMAGMAAGHEGQMSGMNMGAANAGNTGGEMAGMKMGDTGNGHGTPQMAGAAMGGTAGAQMSGMNHSGHDMSGTSAMSAMNHNSAGMAGMEHGGSAMNMQPEAAKLPTEGRKVSHGPDNHGPGAAMVAESPKSRLDDPGVGLQDVGHKVLVYNDLRSRVIWPDKRPPERELELHLTGNMERYMWSFDGKKYSEVHGIQFKYNERLRLILVNDTMMDHPIHLHGMWMELENRHGDYRPRKHTISVKPGEMVSALITADAKGHWAFHCHLLYHMEAGMFRVVTVA